MDYREYVAVERVLGARLAFDPPNARGRQNYPAVVFTLRRAAPVAASAAASLRRTGNAVVMEAGRHRYRRLTANVIIAPFTSS